MVIFDGILKLLETIYEYAETELYNEDALKKRLIELHMRYELGDIDESEYEKSEEKLLEQLKEAIEYNKDKNRELENDEDYDENDEDPGEENDEDDGEENGG